MNVRERFQAVMNFKPFDRLPVVELPSWWDKTIERWHSEGLPPELTDRYDICRHFGLDIHKQDWVVVATPECPVPQSHGSGIIKSDEDYERVLPEMYPQQPIDPLTWQNWAEEQRQGDVVLCFVLGGFFWIPRWLLGIERHLFAFYDQTELMHRINSDLAEWMEFVIEQICSICTPEYVIFAEDLSYNHGPMISRDQYEEFMRPYYERVIPVLRKHGVTPILDSDGDVTVMIPWFKDVGITAVYPLERQAGVDVALLHRGHRDMRFIGHFNKMTMDKGEDAMRAEFERLLPVAAKGGFIINCDHQTPPGVSYENYKTYVSLFKEYAAKAGELSQKELV